MRLIKTNSPKRNKLLTNGYMKTKKFLLEEKDIPTAWYNIVADMKNKPAPLLNPATLKPMTAEELENNLGTIAKSGSAEFKAAMDKADENTDIIGQFGVGFYSAFMVADKITVETKNIHDEKGHTWVSSGEDGYTITENEKTTSGSRITLDLKADTDDENYSDYLEEYVIRRLIKKYSDYVRYPIEMEVEKSIPDPTDKDKTITTNEIETLNSMTPLWKKAKSSIKPEEYNEFYKAKFSDWEDPAKVIHYNVEGTVSYTALLYIPSKTPYNFYYSDFEPGLELYSKGVFIMDKAKDLIPDYYRFVTGLVDSDDLNLNISREILQQDRQDAVHFGPWLFCYPLSEASSVHARNVPAHRVDFRYTGSGF